MKVKIGDLTKIKTGKLDANASSEDGQYPFFTCLVLCQDLVQIKMRSSAC